MHALSDDTRLEVENLASHIGMDRLLLITLHIISASYAFPITYTA